MRPAISTLWKLDLAFADVVATSSDQRLGAIRLAWWRERLEELGSDAAAPAEPRLKSVQSLLLPRAVSGTELSRLEDAWLPLLDPFPWGERQASGLGSRGRLLFGIAARLMGEDPHEAKAAGVVWSLNDGAEHTSDDGSRILLKQMATLALSQLPLVTPRGLRPLTVLAALAASDLAFAGRFGRGGAALRHRLTGRYPRQAASRS